MPAPGVDDGVMTFARGSVSQSPMTVGSVVWTPMLSGRAGEVLQKMAPETREAMASGWREETKLVHDADTEEHDIPDLPKRSACYYAGFCLCNKPWLRKYVCNLQVKLRRDFKKGSNLFSSMGWPFCISLQRVLLGV